MQIPFASTVRAVKEAIFTRPAKTGAVRRFDGAVGGRRGFGMVTFFRINSEVAGAGASVRSRARYLAVNNPWLRPAVDNRAGVLVGAGITLAPKHPDAATRKAL